MKADELYQKARSSILAIEKQLVELEKQKASLVTQKLQWQGAAEACMAIGWATPEAENSDPDFMKEGDE